MVLKPCKWWDFNYQPQLVFSPDFWIIKSRKNNSCNSSRCPVPKSRVEILETYSICYSEIPESSKGVKFVPLNHQKQTVWGLKCEGLGMYNWYNRHIPGVPKNSGTLRRYHLNFPVACYYGHFGVLTWMWAIVEIESVKLVIRLGGWAPNTLVTWLESEPVCKPFSWPFGH